METVDSVVAEIIDLYKRFGHEDYIGEPVSQLEHMSQSAELAIENGFDDEVVLAAFFHDIGHICVAKNNSNDMAGYGIKSHEKIGADFLRARGFPERLAQLIENHVKAKRYLTYKNPDYYNQLSDASKKTLEHQGGMMNQEEALVFEKDPLFKICLLLRTWDEQAKEINKPVINLELIRSKSRALLMEQEKT